MAAIPVERHVPGDGGVSAAIRATRMRISPREGRG